MDNLTKTTLRSLDDPKKQKILILGGGFGGIKTALELADNPRFEVTLLSDRRDFRYYPLLYRSATGGSRVASSIPLTEIFEGKDLSITQDEATGLDRNQKTIKGKSGKSYSYDLLIVALGVVTNYFGIKGLKEYSYGIKTLEDAHELRDHLHKQLVDEQKPDLNYVVIGGGATGVELAGVLPGYIGHIMKRHGLPKRQVEVDIVEAKERLIPDMNERYSRALAKRLSKLGVELHLDQRVEAETADSLVVSGNLIRSRTVIWTAGVTNHPFLKHNGFTLSDRSKAVVNENLQTEPDIYIIGDNADTPYSGLAQTALRDGLYVSDNIKRRAAGKSPLPYKPKRPAYVTPCGNWWAAVSWGSLQLYGLPGWFLRRVADFIGYHDLEPWWKASKHWLADNDREESCPICAPKKGGWAT